MNRTVKAMEDKTLGALVALIHLAEGKYKGDPTGEGAKQVDLRAEAFASLSRVAATLAKSQTGRAIAASSLGAKGGAVKSAAKTASSRANGRLGGRPPSGGARKLRSSEEAMAIAARLRGELGREPNELELEVIRSGALPLHATSGELKAHLEALRG